MEKLKQLPINGAADFKKMQRAIGILDPKGVNKNPLNGQPYSKRYSFLAETGNTDTNPDRDPPERVKTILEKDKGKGWQYEIVYKEYPTFLKLLLTNQIILVIAGTGTGKTVIIPKLLLHYFGYTKPLFITMPTVKSVQGAVGFAAACMDVVEGEHVGYRAGGVNKTSKKSMLIYATEKSVQMQIINSPNLDEYYGVILDEIHLRKVDQDMLLATVCDIALRRPEFKVIIMSATISPEPFKVYFQNKGLIYDLYEPPSKSSKYNVIDIYYPKLIDHNNLVAETGPTAQKIEELLKTTKYGSILVFVPSGASGQKLAKYFDAKQKKEPTLYMGKFWATVIEGKTDETTLGKWITAKSGADYHNFRPDLKDCNRKLIFATNAVEFSVSFSKVREDDGNEYGLDYVIDTGIAYVNRFDPVKNCSVMGTEYITKANIGQRRGRTGRTGEGTCFHMYPEDFYKTLPDDQQPEIKNHDITDETIKLIGLPYIASVKNGINFLENMITSPNKENITIAVIKMIKNDIIELNSQGNGVLSPLGELVIKFGKHSYQTARMIIAGYYFGCIRECIIIAAILFVCSKGLTDIFIQPAEGSKSEKDAIVEKIIKYWKSNSGDIITIFKIYYSTLDPKIYSIPDEATLEDKLDERINTKWSQRMSYCASNFINYQKILLIDKEFYELSTTVIELLPDIKKLKLFDIIKENQNKHKLIFLKGGKKKKSKKKHAKQQKPQHIDPVPNETNNNNNIDRKIDNDNIPDKIEIVMNDEVDGEANENKIQEEMEGEQQESPPAATQDINNLIPDAKDMEKKQDKEFVKTNKKEDKKSKKKKKKDKEKRKQVFRPPTIKPIEKSRKFVEAEGIDEIDFIPSDEPTDTLDLSTYEKQENIKEEPAPSKKQHEIQKILLNKINIMGMTNMKFTLFPDITDNIISALFFGYYTNIAMGLDSKKDKNKYKKTYLVKHVDKTATFQTSSVDGSTLSFNSALPTFIVYNNFNIVNGARTLTFPTIIKRQILHKFIPNIF